MDNVNKPAAISVAATVIDCIAAVKLLVGNAAPAYRHGLYYLGDGTQPAGTGVYGLSTADKR